MIKQLGGSEPKRMANEIMRQERKFEENEMPSSLIKIELNEGRSTAARRKSFGWRKANAEQGKN